MKKVKVCRDENGLIEAFYFEEISPLDMDLADSVSETASKEAVSFAVPEEPGLHDLLPPEDDDDDDDDDGGDEEEVDRPIILNGEPR